MFEVAFIYRVINFNRMRKWLRRSHGSKETNITNELMVGMLRVQFASSVSGPILTLRLFVLKNHVEGEEKKSSLAQNLAISKKSTIFL